MGQALAFYLMLNSHRSFISLQHLSSNNLNAFFDTVKSLKIKNFRSDRRGSVALMFFEASTRTRLSFEMAAHRVGLQTVLFDGGQKTSLEKGETLEDSILNVAAMRPQALVIRCGDQVDLLRISQQVGEHFQVPVLNAGWGQQGHPSQALLDYYTLFESFGSLRGLKVLILGDAKHSRVIASHLELSQALGIELSYCGPDFLAPKDFKGRHFQSLSEALSWADAVYCLRFQFERHSTELGISQADYISHFQLSEKVIDQSAQNKNLKVLHPGPVNQGLEIEQGLTLSSRSLVFQQVQNGVLVRQALLAMSQEAR